MYSDNKIVKEDRWHGSWHRYAEFLRKNGRRPEYKRSRERSLYVWYSSSWSKSDNGQLDNEQEQSFLKLTDNGDTYKFYVVGRESNIPKLAFFGREGNVFGNVVGDGKVDFEESCKGYTDFCDRLERHPWMKIREEVELAKWFLKAKDDFFNSRLTDHGMKLFDKLLQSTKKYRNDNIITHASRLPEGNFTNEERSEVLNADDGTEFHAGVQQSHWFEMCERYSKYLDDNKKVPTQYGDRQLYHWIYRQKKALTEGSLQKDRKDALEKLLAQIDEIRKDYPIEPSNGWTKKQGKEDDFNSLDGERENGESKQVKSKRKPVKQDDLWNEKWQAYMDYMEKNKRRPSKHHAEDMVLFDWFKHSKKLLNQGRMQEDRIAKFKQLLGEAKDYQRINQHNYVNPEIKVKEPVIRLYDYQADMKRRIEKAFLKFNSVMVQMPTGTGKTHVIASVVRDFVRDDMGEVWVVAHRRELVAQIQNTLGLYLSDDEMTHIRATSIQWLTNHYKDMREQPSLLVIDEAHHAIAKTYSAVMDSYPNAKKLGVTATPYRLSGAGFKDLFDILLTSWDIKKFIKEKRLCPFDYYCITRKSIEMFKVDGLKKRGADGDYQAKELDENFNQKVIIARLYESYEKFAKGKRGFVYAINIDHAEKIAEYYREKGVTAVAVSSQTPDRERSKDIEDFKNGKITILCSVDLFSEGFDAPDAEFIQLARPTLSLAKYLQMVGRGLRMAKGKKTCIILDNVGLKDKFGLPSRERNWTYYFNGDWKRHRRRKDYYGDPISLTEEVLDAYIGPVDADDMVLEASHEDLIGEKNKYLREYEVVKTRDGRQGIVDKNGKEILPLEYDHVAINEDGIAGVQWGDITKWYDLLNGLWYEDIPKVGYVGSIPIAYVKHYFYPRLRSQWITDSKGISEKEMLWQFGDGLGWSNLFITWVGKPKVYRVVDTKSSGARLLRDEEGKRYVQRNPRVKPVSVGYIKDLDAWFEKRKEAFDDFVERAKAYPVEYDRTSIEDLDEKNKRVWWLPNDIITVVPHEGKKYWIDWKTHRKYYSKPKKAQIRIKADLLYIDDYVFIRNSTGRNKPYQDWQIRADRDKIYIDNARY